MPSDQPTVQATVDERIKALIESLARKDGRTTSNFVRLLLEREIASRLSAAEQEDLLKSLPEGRASPKARTRRQRGQKAA